MGVLLAQVCRRKFSFRCSVGIRPFRSVPKLPASRAIHPSLPLILSPLTIFNICVHFHYPRTSHLAAPYPTVKPRLSSFRRIRISRSSGILSRRASFQCPLQVHLLYLGLRAWTDTVKNPWMKQPSYCQSKQKPSRKKAANCSEYGRLEHFSVSNHSYPPSPHTVSS